MRSYGNGSFNGIMPRTLEFVKTSGRAPREVPASSRDPAQDMSNATRINPAAA
jgi:hypothetical protein